MLVKYYIITIIAGVLASSLMSFFVFSIDFDNWLSVVGIILFASIFSFILFKKFPQIWKKVNIRLYCISLFLIIYTIGWYVLGFFLMYDIYIPMIKQVGPAFFLMLTFLVGIFLPTLGTMFVMIIPHILFAYFVTKDIKRPIKRILFMLLLIVLALWSAGFYWVRMGIS